MDIKDVIKARVLEENKDILNVLAQRYKEIYKVDKTAQELYDDVLKKKDEHKIVMEDIQSMKKSLSEEQKELYKDSFRREERYGVIIERVFSMRDEILERNPNMRMRQFENDYDANIDKGGNTKEDLKPLGKQIEIVPQTPDQRLSKISIEMEKLNLNMGYVSAWNLYKLSKEKSGNISISEQKIYDTAKNTIQKEADSRKVTFEDMMDIIEYYSKLTQLEKRVENEMNEEKKAEKSNEKGIGAKIKGFIGKVAKKIGIGKETLEEVEGVKTEVETKEALQERLSQRKEKTKEIGVRLGLTSDEMEKKINAREAQKIVEVNELSKADVSYRVIVNKLKENGLSEKEINKMISPITGRVNTNIEKLAQISKITGFEVADLLAGDKSEDEINRLAIEVKELGEGNKKSFGTKVQEIRGQLAERFSKTKTSLGFTEEIKELDEKSKQSRWKKVMAIGLLGAIFVTDAQGYFKSNEKPKELAKAPAPIVENLNTVDFMQKLMKHDKMKVATPEQQVATPEPEVVTPKPEVVTPKPEVVTPKPEVVTPKPEVVTPKPQVATPKPQEVLETVVKIPDDSKELLDGVANNEVKNPQVANKEFTKESVELFNRGAEAIKKAYSNKSLSPAKMRAEGIDQLIAMVFEKNGMSTGKPITEKILAGVVKDTMTMISNTPNIPNVTTNAVTMANYGQLDDASKKLNKTEIAKLGIRKDSKETIKVGNDVLVVIDKAISENYNSIIGNIKEAKKFTVTKETAESLAAAALQKTALEKVDALRAEVAKVEAVVKNAEVDIISKFKKLEADKKDANVKQNELDNAKAELDKAVANKETADKAKIAADKEVADKLKEAAEKESIRIAEAVKLEEAAKAKKYQEAQIAAKKAAEAEKAAETAKIEAAVKLEEAAKAAEAVKAADAEVIAKTEDKAKIAADKKIADDKVVESEKGVVIAQGNLLHVNVLKTNFNKELADGVSVQVEAGLTATKEAKEATTAEVDSKNFQEEVRSYNIDL